MTTTSCPSPDKRKWWQRITVKPWVFRDSELDREVGGQTPVNDMGQAKTPDKAPKVGFKVGWWW
jgi:hypothetical protein